MIVASSGGKLWVQAWCTGWWNAEREEALRQLDDILDAEAAWQPAPALWGSAPSDGLEESSAEDNQDEPRHAAVPCLTQLGYRSSNRQTRLTSAWVEDPMASRLKATARQHLARKGQAM